MKKSILSLCFITFVMSGNSFSKYPIHVPSIVKAEPIANKRNYQYFSKLLIYPLNVDKTFHIINGGNTYFKISVFDDKMSLIVSLNTSPFCSTSVTMDSYKPGKYIINVDSESETHQFYFIKTK